MRVTFKVHKVELRDILDGAPREERLTLHPIDPHEDGAHDHAAESRSGEGKLMLKITEPSQLGKYLVGAYVTVDINPLPLPVFP